MPAPTSTPPTRRRVPASERRVALVEAAVHEFAHGGLHGTPVQRIADRVGVTQPYVFTLFEGKRGLFLAAVERCFAATEQLFSDAATAHRDAGGAEEDIFEAMGKAYVESLETHRHHLMLQHQAYAACGDEVIRANVRRAYAHLVEHARGLTGADSERLDEFFRYGMWLNVGAALGEDLSAGCEWMLAEGERA